MRPNPDQQPRTRHYGRVRLWGSLGFIVTVWALGPILDRYGAEAFARVESARGEMGCYVYSDGTENAGRIKFRTGSFAAMCIIEDLSPADIQSRFFAGRADGYHACEQAHFAWAVVA